MKLNLRKKLRNPAFFAGVLWLVCFSGWCFTMIGTYPSGFNAYTLSDVLVAILEQVCLFTLGIYAGKTL